MIDLHKPVDSIFTEINDLAIARIAKSPMTEQQQNDTAYIVLTKAKPFQSALTKWGLRPTEVKTWDNFKEYFQAVQVALHKTGGITVDDRMNHADLVNMVSEGVHQAIEAQTPPETINNVQDNNQSQNVHQQLAKMRTLVEQLRTDNQALQVSKAPNHHPPLQDMINTQA